jgi:hypothetical protein
MTIMPGMPLRILARGAPSGVTNPRLATPRLAPR